MTVHNLLINYVLEQKFLRTECPSCQSNNTWSRAQESSSETAAFVPPDLLLGTVSQTSFTALLTLIYSNTASKLYSSREHIVTNFVSAPGWLLLLLSYESFIISILIIVITKQSHDW